VEHRTDVLALIGMKHSGKSSVGNCVAGRLGRNLVDHDHLIVEYVRRWEYSASGLRAAGGDTPAAPPEETPHAEQEETAATPRGLEITDVRSIYRVLGEERFRRAELESVREFLHAPGSEPSAWVLACGGGVADNPEALDLLASHTFLVYLSEDEDVLWNRIVAGGIPAFLPRTGARAAFRRLYAARSARYAASAHHTVSVESRAIDEVCEEVVALARAKP